VSAEGEIISSASARRVVLPAPTANQKVDRALTMRLSAETSRNLIDHNVDDESGEHIGTIHSFWSDENTIQNWVMSKFDAVLVCTAGDFAAMQKVYESAAAFGLKRLIAFDSEGHGA
jgi:hypothetical protein